MTVSIIDSRSLEAVPRIIASLYENGFAIAHSVLAPEFISEARFHLRHVAEKIDRELAGRPEKGTRDCGVYRLLFAYHDFFLKMIDRDLESQVVDSYLGSSSILRFQLGIIYKSEEQSTSAAANYDFHQNFPYIQCSPSPVLEVLYSLSDVKPTEGGFLLVPGSHLYSHRPELSALERQMRGVDLPVGSVLFMDGCLWHKQTKNTTPDEHCFVSSEFSHPLIRAHFDHERLFGPKSFESLPEKIRQRLGYNVRLPGSLLEFYQPEENRRFKSQPIKVLGLKSRSNDNK